MTTSPLLNGPVSKHIEFICDLINTFVKMSAVTPLLPNGPRIDSLQADIRGSWTSGRGGGGVTPPHTRTHPPSASLPQSTRTCCASAGTGCSTSRRATSPSTGHSPAPFVDSPDPRFQYESRTPGSQQEIYQIPLFVCLSRSFGRGFFYANTQGRLLPPWLLAAWHRLEVPPPLCLNPFFHPGPGCSHENV